MGNIQVKVCKPASAENAFNCANPNLLRQGFCKGLRNDVKFFSKDNYGDWNGDTSFICASGFKAANCNSGGCMCVPTENCGKLRIIPLIIITIIVLFCLFISIYSTKQF